MKTIMVRYRTTEEHAKENEALVRAVFEELHALAPEGFTYTSFKLPDGVTFVHVATVMTSEHPLGRVSAFKTFQEQLKGRCCEPPVATEVTVVGTYGTGFDERPAPEATSPLR
jgi:hypothetical protein